MSVFAPSQLPLVVHLRARRIPLEFLSKSPAEDLAGDVERLAQLAFMFIEVASSVEFYREPDVPAGFSADRFLIHN